MKCFPIALGLLLASFGSANLFADKPLSNHLPDTDITGLVLAKFQTVDGQGKVAFRIPAWKETLSTETFEVEVPKTEIQTQEVVKDGKITTREVPVTVTVVETRTQTVANYSPKDPVKGEVALEKIKAWNLKGKQLSAEELKESLSKAIYLLCLSAEPAEGIPPLDPFYANAFRSDTLIVYSDELDGFFQSSVERAPEPAESSDATPAEAAPAPPEPAADKQ
jgi:hypothetical protein